MIVKSNHRLEYRTDSLVIFPNAMLVAHAVEVYLKAWLAGGHVSRKTMVSLRYTDWGFQGCRTGS